MDSLKFDSFGRKILQLFTSPVFVCSFLISLAVFIFLLLIGTMLNDFGIIDLSIVYGKSFWNGYK